MTTTRYFYAHENRHGVGATFQRYDGSIDALPGSVHRFTSRAARDAWVADDVWDGRYRREAVSAAVVRNAIAREERRGGRPCWEDYDALTGEALPYEFLAY